MNNIAKTLLENQLTVQTYSAILMGITLVIGIVWRDFFIDVINKIPFFKEGGLLSKLLFPFIVTILLVSFGIGLRHAYEVQISNANQNSMLSRVRRKN